MPLSRYFRFRLRTLLFVLVPLCAVFGWWVNYSRALIGEREEFWRKVRESKTEAHPYHVGYATRPPDSAWFSPMRAWFGLLEGEQIYEVHLDVSSDADRKLVERLEPEAKRLFPEATVVVWISPRLTGAPEKQ